MEVRQLQQKLKSSVENLYVLSGAVAYRLDSALKIFKALTDEELQCFNYAKYCGILELDTAIMVANTVPVMAERRVVVWIAESLSPTHVSVAIDKITQYATHEQSQCVLIVIDGEEKLKKLYKRAEVVNCGMPSTHDVIHEAQLILNESGLQSTPEITKELLARCNNDLSIFDNELNKIKMYLDATTAIDINSLDECVPRSVQYSVFKISDNVTQRNAFKVLDNMNDLLQRGEEPMVILSVLTGFYRMCFYLKISKMAKEEFMTRHSLAEFRYMNMERAIKYYSPMKLKGMTEYLQNLEYRVKSGRLAPKQAIELASCELTAFDK